MPTINTATIITFGVYDTAANDWKTGDAGNLGVWVIADGVKGAIADTVAEVDATDTPGEYEITIAADENTGAMMVVAGKSSTANVIVISKSWANSDPVILYVGPHGTGVWIDDAAANTNTVVGVDGIESNPVSTIAAATTIATALGTRTFYLVNDSAITLAQGYDGYVFLGIGNNNSVALGGQDVDNSWFENLALTGAQGGTGAARTHDCYLNGLTSLEIIASNCWIGGPITLRASTFTLFAHCVSAVAGNNTPQLTFPTGVVVNLNVRDYSGGLEIHDMDANHTMSYEARGQLVINADCTGGAASLRGPMTVTDNASGAVTLTRGAALNLADIWGYATRTLTAQTGGDKVCTITLDDGTNPVGACPFQVWDASNTLVALGTTNSGNGKYTVNLSEETYTVTYGPRANYSFDDNPFQLVVGSGSPQTFTHSCALIAAPATPGSALLCNCYVDMRQVEGGQLLGAGEGTMNVTGIRSRPDGSTELLTTDVAAASTDANGRASISIVREAVVEIELTWPTGETDTRVVTVPDLATYDVGVLFQG